MIFIEPDPALPLASFAGSKLLGVSRLAEIKAPLTHFAGTVEAIESYRRRPEGAQLKRPKQSWPAGTACMESFRTCS